MCSKNAMKRGLCLIVLWVASSLASGGAQALRPPDAPVFWPSPSVYELPSEALAAWRIVGGEGATLVLLSLDPWLESIPDVLSGRVRVMAQEGSPGELASMGRVFTADPLLLPTQTVTAAIAAGLMSRLVWLTPTPAGGVEPDVEVFRRQLVESGVLSKAQGESWQSVEGGLEGDLGGAPARFVFSPQGIQEFVRGPILLHLDLSYFLVRYQNEVQTPIYELLRGTLEGLLRQLPRLAVVSVTYSTVEGRVPLNFRFVGNDLIVILNDLKLLESPLPDHWRARSKALYLANLYESTKASTVYQGMVEKRPNDATLFYALYLLRQGQDTAQEALEYLARAVELDAAYALEYLSLAQTAAERRLGSVELEMLDAARRLVGENPFVRLRRAEALLRAGTPRGALAVVEELRELRWSPVYHPEIPGVLDALAAEAAGRLTPP